MGLTYTKDGNTLIISSIFEDRVTREQLLAMKAKNEKALDGINEALKKCDELNVV